MTPEPLDFTGHEGLRLAADAVGPLDGPPVLLLHGGGQTRHAWGGTARALARAGMRAVSLDARGHGESEWSELGHYHLTHFVRDLRCVVAAFERAPAIVGASLGGSTALMGCGDGMAARALVLVDIAPQIQPAGVQRIEDFMRAAPNGFESLDAVADAVASYLPHRRRPTDVSGLKKNLRLIEGRYHWHWDPRFIETITEPGSGFEHAEAAARALTVPTLLVRGKLSDLLSEEGAAAFLELVPHARYVDVSNAGHMVAGDQNDRFTEAVVGFLSALQR